MSNDNGTDPLPIDQPDKDPTPEELLAKKKEDFEKNPENFLNFKYVVAAAFFSPEQKQVVISVNPSAPREDLGIAHAELNYFIQNELTRRMMAKQKNKFTTAPNGGNGKLKGKFGKKRF